MTAPDLIVHGQVVVRADAAGLRTAAAIAVTGGHVVAIGSREEMRRLAGPGTRTVDEPDRAVIPGLHDFHLHLVGMARRRREASLDGLDPRGVVAALTRAAGPLPEATWLRGRGWNEASLPPATVAALNEALRTRPALIYSHDSHSAWASPAALAAAGLAPAAPDPTGGRIERDAAGLPTGVLREAATDLVEAVAGRMRGPELDAALDEALAELSGWGVTGASDAGDTSVDNGMGADAALGDRASLLLAAAPRIDGRLRLAIGFPAAAISAASARGMATTRPLSGHRTVRGGWAKAYADGALGSRTAAIFDPYTCGDGAGTGILRLSDDELDELLAAGRRAGIGLAVHAIGDRAAAATLDAMQRAAPRLAATPPDRIEHLQLLNPADLQRLAGLDVTASVQPVHAAADREMVEACWRDRADRAYPWRTLAAAGTRLAFGSDAPIETANPWLGIFAAVHRRFPDDETGDWRPSEALSVESALAGYTIGPARAAAQPDEGHLQPGARADLAVLDVGLATLLAADERLADVHSLLTLVAGREVHRA